MIRASPGECRAVEGVIQGCQNVLEGVRLREIGVRGRRPLPGNLLRALERSQDLDAKLEVTVETPDQTPIPTGEGREAGPAPPCAPPPAACHPAVDSAGAWSSAVPPACEGGRSVPAHSASSAIPKC